MHLPQLRQLRVTVSIELSKKKSLGDELPLVATDAGGDTVEKETKSKTGIIGSQPRGNHNVFTHCPKDPNC